MAVTITSSQLEGSAKKWTPPGRTGEEREPLFSYLAEISGATLGPSDTDSSDTDSTGARLVHFLVTWAPFRTKDLPGTPAPTPTRDGSLLQIAPHDAEQSPMLSAALESGIGPVSVPKLLIAIAILACSAAALCWARRKLSVPCFVPAPTLGDQMARLSPKGPEAILLVGPPRTRKDEAVFEAITAVTGKPPAERLHLLDRKEDAENAADVARINALAQQDDGARLAPDGRLWIHISNLEAQLSNAVARTNALKLLEQLRDERDGAVAKVLIVTTNIDPIANFEEVFETERKGIYDDVVPEVGLNRSSLILSRFRRCYVPILCERSAPCPLAELAALSA